jgi:predicted DNA-binding transcriptional regulator AlpA
MNDFAMTVTKREIATLLRKSVRTVERIIAAGALPNPLPMPGHPRWSREAIAHWIATGATTRAA